MPNRLINATSPYLRQHQDNPVDWYPWDDKAIKKAQTENKPIFLSIGYAACHWCHVMAHESFEDPQTASLLNHHFISIKVDREERPDLDDIYMRAVVTLTGQGGWPMSVFLTPDLKPFYGGTYFPPVPKYRMPSFTQVLRSVIDVWKNNPEGVQNNARVLTNTIEAEFQETEESEKNINLGSIVQNLYRNFDWKGGGWGNAPKFPQAMLIQFLIQRAMRGDHLANEMSAHVLNHMAQGGMYDLIGGGFHRYSTDPDWLVPHFEKMLYDNALLAKVYLQGYALSGNPFYKQITEDTLDFILRDMTHPDGGFFASLDADTIEGEGRYYTWHKQALKDILTKEQFNLLEKAFELPEEGNFEDGLLILRYKENPDVIAKKLSMPVENLIDDLTNIFSMLRKKRKERTPPTKDDKIITSWNTLAIQAFAQAGLLLGRERYLNAAKTALNFILIHLSDERGKIMRSWNRGKMSNLGTLSDYAGLILALHAVYEIDFSPSIFAKIREVFGMMTSEFMGNGLFYFDTHQNLNDLLLRPRNLQDNATPSGNALAAYCHWLMAQYDQDVQHEEIIVKMVRRIFPKASNYPFSFGFWLKMADIMQHPAQQIALVTNEGLETIQPFLKIYRDKYRPNSVITANYEEMKQSRDWPLLLKDREVISNLPTAYVCLGHTCQQPTNDVTQFSIQLM